MRLALGALLALAPACLESQANVCANGRVCPPSTTCDDDHGICVSQGQRDACGTAEDGDPCVFGSQSGHCHLGVCVLGDGDGDGITGAADNCPSAQNPAQEDEDGDGFGDLCDGCPALATERNHDEDADFVGDDCDVCPNVVDLQEDANGDGVGDACASGASRTATLLTFETFEDLGPDWSATADWVTLGDEVVPAAPLSPGDPGLRRDFLAVEEPQWVMAVGFRSRAAWNEDDRVALALVDEGGEPVLSCEIRCAPDCELTITDPERTESVPVSSVVLGELRMTWVRSGGVGLACDSEGGSHVFSTLVPVAPGAPALSTSPDIPLRYFAAWQYALDEG